MFSFKQESMRKLVKGKHAARFPLWRERMDRQPLAGGGK